MSQSVLPQHMSHTAHAEQLYAQQQSLLLEHQRAQQELQANLHLQSIQQREQLLRGSSGLNQTDLHLIHQQSRLHEESLRRAAAEQRNQALISGIPGVGQSQMENAIRQNSLMEQQRVHAQALASQHEALLRNPFAAAGSSFAAAGSQLLQLDPRAAALQQYRLNTHQPK
jgi:hypothetical protein